MSKTPLRAVRIETELWEKARAVADENGDNLSDIIRRALRLYVESAAKDIERRSQGYIQRILEREQ